MEKRFLTKKTKVIIREDIEPNGLKVANSVRKESGVFNSDALKDLDKKLSNYYDFDNDEDFTIPKVDRSEDETSPLDIYDTEALGAGKMYGLKYDDEDTEVYDSFVKRNDKLNDTSEYDDIFGTHDGFGETKEKDDTYKKLKDASKKYKEYKYDLPTEYQKTPRVRVTKGVNENKMKRLNFKKEFINEYEMKKLIPENYDGHTFLMTDGNQTFKVRWDQSIKEGTILNSKNKSQINEDTNKMKKLFNYKHSDSMGKSTDYSEETKLFKTLFESVKGKKIL
ncbi:MAG: hypothetical protein ACW980_21840 [Promethearchaeota archaeon]|jgi:hypothetical protein